MMIIITIFVRKRAIGGLLGILIFWDATGEKKFQLLGLVVHPRLYLKLLSMDRHHNLVSLLWNNTSE